MKALSNEADERLLVEAAQRDPTRFAELYERNFERVYPFILRRVQNRSRAEDLTSDVFHQALKNFRNYEWRGVPFAAWLLRIARNAVVDHFQKATREQNPSDEERGGDARDLEAVEQRATLFALVSTLPADQTGGNSHAFRRGKKRSRDRGGAETNRSGETASVPRLGEAAAANGGCP